MAQSLAPGIYSEVLAVERWLYQQFAYRSGPPISLAITMRHEALETTRTNFEREGWEFNVDYGRYSYSSRYNNNPQGCVYVGVYLPSGPLQRPASHGIASAPTPVLVEAPTEPEGPTPEMLRVDSALEQLVSVHPHMTKDAAVLFAALNDLLGAPELRGLIHALTLLIKREHVPITNELRVAEALVRSDALDSKVAHWAAQTYAKRVP